MKRLFPLTLALTLTFSVTFSQQGEWTWMKGSNFSYGVPVYGTQGVSDPANTPASMYEPIEWTDHNGNFWLFGGLRDFGSQYNTLWKFDPSVNEWTWVKGSTNCCTPGVYGTQGVPGPNNMPGARAWGTCSWVDNDGNLWLYGGIGYDEFGSSECLSDLWKYNITTDEWTWVYGPKLGTDSVDYGTIGVPDILNTPGARAESNASWVDEDNNLWMFGGALYAAFAGGGGWSIQGFGNDLWKFDIDTMLWIWMKGTQQMSGPGIYGTKGVPSINNYPPGRGSYAKWIDSNQNLWLFGGYNLGSSWNDVWRYNITDNMWTWMSGSNVANANGNFGTLCEPDINNAPPSRYENRAFWIDGEGNFWSWGGIRTTVNNDIMGDLWQYNPLTNEWTWVSGSSLPNQSGSYGTIEVSSPTNVPPSNFGSVGWSDDNGNFWMFGGSPVLWEARNDLWKYVPDPNCPLPPINFGSTTTTLCEKYCTDFFDSSANDPVSWLWLFPGATPSSSIDQNPVNICYDNPGIFDVTLITTDINSISDTLTLFNYITVYTNPFAPVITQNGNVLTSSPAFSYQWYFNTVIIPGATSQSITITQGGFYTVVIADTNGCTSQASIDAFFVGMEELYEESLISLYPNPTTGMVTIKWSSDLSDADVVIEIFNMMGQSVFSSEQKFIANHSSMVMDLNTLAPGAYFLDMKTDNHWIRKKLMLTR